jgi:chitodextrinase
VPQPRTFSPVKVKAYTVDIPGLEANTRYVFTVRALNNRNGASASAETRTTTPSRCNGPPRPPMDVKTRSDSPTSITVNWLTEANDPCIERFEVTYVLESSTIAPRSLAPLYVTEKTVTLTGLQPDSTYSIVIASVGKNGQRASVTTKGKTQPNCNPLKAPANTYGKQVSGGLFFLWRFRAFFFFFSRRNSPRRSPSSLPPKNQLGRAPRAAADVEQPPASVRQDHAGLVCGQLWRSRACHQPGLQRQPIHVCQHPAGQGVHDVRALHRQGRADRSCVVVARGSQQQQPGRNH